MSKRGLPTNLRMRSDSHYIEDLVKPKRVIGRILSTDKIKPNPQQPRTEMGDLTELVASIKEKGVLEPILVKPLNESETWLIIAGERRWRAAQLAGLREIPCVELEVNDQEVAEIALVENLQRKDLTIWEEADALAALCHRFNYKHEDLAKKIGKSRSTITESLTIASLSQSIRERCIEAGISAKSAILLIARQFDEGMMVEAIKSFKTRNAQPAAPSNSDEQTTTGENEAAKIPAISAKDKTKNENEIVSFPVKTFFLSADHGNYKLELKFKKPSDKNAVIEALEDILKKLKNQ